MIEFEAERPSYAAPVEKAPLLASDPGRVDVHGQIDRDDLAIYIPEDVLSQVVEFSDSDLGMELGGVFVGDLHSWKGRPYVEIVGYIPAEHYENTAASFRFTHESWDWITQKAEEDFEGRPRLGWHHTHPGYGIFLSGADQFIQNNFFNLPYMFGMVTDPRSGKLGFFQNKKNKIEPVGFYVVR
jgi:proteasome lid subunit RPN8/RPN11